MLRSPVLAVLAATLLGCASQPICAPWSPATLAPAATAMLPTTADVPSPNTQATREMAGTVRDDGTVFVAAPSNDEEWTSVVGKGAPRAAPAPTPGAVRAKPATLAQSPRAAERNAGPVATSQSAKAAPAFAKPAPPSAAAKPKAIVQAENPVLRAEARALFAGRCVPCHGSSGRGDGPAGSALTPHPRNFTDKAWQATVTASHIEHVVANGGPSVGKSPLMPAQADLAQRPELLHALALYVQELGR